MGTQGVTRTRLADEREKKKGLVDTPGRSRSLVLKVFVLIQLLKSLLHPEAICLSVCQRFVKGKGGKFKQEGLLLTTGFMLRTDKSVQLGAASWGLFVCMQSDAQTVTHWETAISGPQQPAIFATCIFMTFKKIRAEMLTSRTQFSGVLLT